MKRSWYVVLVMGLALCLAFAGPALAKKVFLTIGTGSPGGVYYPLGGGMSVVIEKTVDGVRCAAESTGASVENCRFVGSGDTDMGMVMGSVAFKAVQGQEPLKRNIPLWPCSRCIRRPSIS